VAACTSRWGFSDAYPGRTVWAEASWPIAVPSPDRPTPDRPAGDPPGPRRARPVPAPDWPRGPAA